VATQALLYTAAFYITWLPSTIWSITHWFNVPMFWLDLLQRITEPCQGLLNFFVFLRPRKGLQVRLANSFRGLFCFCCGRRDDSFALDVTESETRWRSHPEVGIVSDFVPSEAEENPDVAKAEEGHDDGFPRKETVAIPDCASDSALELSKLEE
jgi:hypothetical protein